MEWSVYVLAIVYVADEFQLPLVNRYVQDSYRNRISTTLLHEIYAVHYKIYIFVGANMASKEGPGSI